MVGWRRHGGVMRGLWALTVAMVAAPLHASELRGWPVRLEGGVSTSSPAVGDLQADGSLEVVLVAGLKVHVLNSTGGALPGWPLTLQPAHKIRDDMPARSDYPGSVTLCDLDGHRKLSIVLVGLDDRLHVYDARAQMRPGFPVEGGGLWANAAACADLDGDGRPELIWAGQDGVIRAVNGAGKEVAGFPLKAYRAAEGLLAVGDFHPDAGVEVAFGTMDGKVHVLRRDARGRMSDVPGFPVLTQFTVSGGPAMADLDGDGQLDLVFGSQDYRIFAVGGDGKLKPGFPVQTEYRVYAQPAVADLDGDGKSDLVVGGGDGRIYALRHDGRPVRGWPVTGGGRILAAAAVGDLDGDGSPEVAVGGGDGRLHVLRASGVPYGGYPLSPGGGLNAAPYITDLDGDGRMDLLVATGTGYLHAYTFQNLGHVKTPVVAWPTYGHDPGRVSRTRPNPALFLDMSVVPPTPQTLDDLKVAYRFVDLDGDPEKGTQIRWFRNGVHVKELDNKPVVPAATTAKRQSWQYTLQEGADHATQGEGRGATLWKSPAVAVGNTPPTPATLALEPAAPDTLADLAARITAPSTDADGDPVVYAFRWFRNREAMLDLPLTTTTVPAARTHKGETWRLAVIPTDGESEGMHATAEVVIRNTPPSALQLALDPSAPGAAQNLAAVIKVPSQDPDREPIRYVYEWKLDDTPLPLLQQQQVFPPLYARKGQRVQLTVTPWDDESAGPSASAAVAYVNTPPQAPGPYVYPPAPGTSWPLWAAVAQPSLDWDGDAVTYSFSWTLNGAAVSLPQGSTIVPSAITARGQKWTLTATPHDGTVAGPAAQLTLVVDDTPPGLAAVAVQPPTPRRSDALTVVVETPASDVDGDQVTYKVRWLLDGKDVTRRAQDRTVPGALVRKGQLWKALVTAHDGQKDGSAAGAVEVRVGDTPPGAPVVALAPPGAGTEQRLRVSVTRPAPDVDGDAVTYRYRWFKDGMMQDLPATLAEVPPVRTGRGEVWAVQVIPVADGAEGEPATAELTVGNTAPRAPRLAVDPPTPTAGQPLQVRVVSRPPDPDGQLVDLQFRWLRNGQDAGVVTPQLPAGRTRKGELWTVEATPRDDVGNGAPARAQVRIGNTPPSPPVLTTAAPVVRANQPIEVRQVSAATDVDKDRLTLHYAWQVDGKPAPQHGGKTRLAPGDFKKNQRLTLTVTPDDGTSKGRPTQLAWQVENTPPTAPVVRFAQSAVAAPQPLDVKRVRPAADVDGDPLTYRYRYYRNGARVKLPEGSESVPARLIKRWDRWTVEVVAFDGQEEGPPGTASAHVINATPSAPQVAFANSKPTVTDPLEVLIRRPSQDPDGDKLAYIYRYTRNGKPVKVPEGTRRLPLHMLHKGERWTVQVVATDGAERSPVAAAEAVVVNTPPTTPAVRFTMAEGWPGVHLDVQVTTAAVDADGDPIAYHHRFFRNEAPLKLNERSPSLDGRNVGAGDRIRVEVVAHDGEARSEVARADIRVARPPPPPRARRDAKGKLIPAAPPPPPPQPPVLPPPPPSPPRQVDRAEQPLVDPDVPPLPTPVVALCSWVTAEKTDDGRALVRADQVLKAVVKWPGTAPRTAHAAWLRNGKPARGTRQDQVPAGVLKKGETWQHVVTEGGNHVGACQELQVSDTAPTAPKVVMEPAHPHTGQPVNARITAPAQDVDGDRLTYRYTWKRAGQVLPLDAAADTLPGSQVLRADQLEVEVVAVGDGMRGPAGTASAEVANTPPGAAQVVLEPSAAPAGVPLHAVVRSVAADLDGDSVAHRFQWRRNGQVVADIAGPGVPMGRTRRGERWEVAVVASDGAAEGPQATAGLTVGNTPPVPPVLKTPAAVIRAGMPLEVKVTRAASDPDGDAVKLAWRWKVDGKPRNGWDGRQALAWADLGKNQRVRLEVTPTDGTDDGPPAVLEVQTVNTGPGAPQVALEMPQVPVTQPLKVVVRKDATDADGDRLAYRHRFFRNGSAVNLPLDTAEVPVRLLKKGDVWDVQVVAFDGEVEGPPGLAAASVLNTAPTAPRLQVEPRRPTTTDALTCRVAAPATDADKDRLTYVIQWLRNGQPTPLMPPGALPPVATGKDEKWRCRAAAHDGEILGPFAESSDVEIGNAPPPTPVVEVMPAAPLVGQDLLCRVRPGAPDADADPVAYTLHWEKNRRPLRALEGQWKVPGSLVRRSDTWGCWAEASDGRGTSPSNAPRTTVKVENTPPTIPVVEIRPERPSAGEDLRCEVVSTATDPDGDKVGYRVAWLRNGQVQGFAPTQLLISGRHTRPGQEWRCVLTASDGHQESPAARSPAVIIQDAVHASSR